MAVSLFNVSELLILLLRKHNRVSLPGMGAFVAEYKPAAIVKGGKLLLPPSKKVSFHSSELWNDGFLEEELVAQNSSSKEEVLSQLEAFIREMSELLKEGKRIEFPDFGTLRISADGEYVFEKDRGLNLLPEAFVLPELKVTPHGNVRSIIYTATPEEPANLQKEPTAKLPDPALATISEENGEKAKPKKKRRMVYWIIAAVILCTILALTLRSVYVFYHNQPKIIELPNGDYTLSDSW